MSWFWGQGKQIQNLKETKTKNLDLWVRTCNKLSSSSPKMKSFLSLWVNISPKSILGSGWKNIPVTMKLADFTTRWIQVRECHPFLFLSISNEDKAKEQFMRTLVHDPPSQPSSPFSMAFPSRRKNGVSSRGVSYETNSFIMQNTSF